LKTDLQQSFQRTKYNDLTSAKLVFHLNLKNSFFKIKFNFSGIRPRQAKSDEGRPDRRRLPSQIRQSKFAGQKPQRIVEAFAARY
jgi:hypothetical protein